MCTVEKIFGRLKGYEGYDKTPLREYVTFSQCRSNWYSLYCYNGTSVRTAKRTIIVYIF